jgi:hypothetical protein
MIGYQKMPNLIKNTEGYNYISDVINKKERHLFLRIGRTESGYLTDWLRLGSLSYLEEILNIELQRRWISCTGIFPLEKKAIAKIFDLYKDIINDLQNSMQTVTYVPSIELDFLKNTVFKDCNQMEDCFNPFSNNPCFQKHLLNKKICVVSCFSKSFENQCDKLEYLFNDRRLVNLNRSDITFIQCPTHKFASNNEQNPYNDWFEILDYLKFELNKANYDILLTSCGGFALPISYEAYKNNKIAINLGGSGQLLFGIKGKRWIDPFYNYNEYWQSPLPQEIPEFSDRIEDGCYW